MFMEKKKYTLLWVVGIAVNAIALLGTFLMLQPLNYLVKTFREATFSHTASSILDSFGLWLVLFYLGIASLAVMALFQIIFYIFEKRQTGVLLAVLLEGLGFILTVHFLNQLVQQIFLAFSSLFGDSDTSILVILQSLSGKLKLVILILLLSLGYHILSYLQLTGRIQWEWLKNMVVESKKEEEVTTEEAHLEAADDMVSQSDQHVADMTEIQEDQPSFDETNESNKDVGGEAE